ncbi:DNA-binding GntR family transcriptional regulator [Spinactinospora alkalitolerans]|uniref:DNA-binding GntR family transcriptional regulator n=1 Tax=Spinactinospora alkalitolerans TaxID=687207 RepID=A0A852TNZ6_9ACTN|nr:GntR family transcriptional regulator [Spinactinospora alkalitolerans]NYE45017.1 DNA-binding GntR family transcriptional regulator [Spinactinospora alkalitolerans]
MYLKDSATDRTYRFAKDAILSRRYAGGELVSEGDIAADVGVSRTPVREALLRLEAEGLVRLYPKRGALIVPVSQQEINDVIETRRLVEGFTAERAAGAGESARLDLAAALTGHLEEMRAGLESDRHAFILADREFHRAIVTASGNEILINLYGSLRDRQLRMMEEGARTVERMRRNIEEHSAILAAVRAGDPAAAREAVRAHMDSAATLLGSNR